jgi:preprotein translocase subunit SecE
MSTEETHENDGDLDTESDSEQEDAADEGALAASPGEPDHGSTGLEEGAGKKTLGLERWVQLAFVVTALMLIWFYDNVISGIWYLFADPTEWMVTFGAVAAGIVTTVALYRAPAAYGLVHDVTDEMARVTWPTRKETSSSTVVVVVTSIVAAVVLFLFDSVWSALTDFVYKV